MTIKRVCSSSRPLTDITTTHTSTHIICGVWGEEKGGQAVREYDGGVSREEGEVGTLSTLMCGVGVRWLGVRRVGRKLGEGGVCVRRHGRDRANYTGIIVKRTPKFN